MSMRPAAFAIIVRGRKILMVRLGYYSHFAGRWNFPGGFVDWSESMARTAIREVREETGLELIIERSFWRGHESASQRSVEMFVGQAVGNLKLQASEIDEAAWFEIDDAIALDLAYRCKDRLMELKAERETA